MHSIRDRLPVSIIIANYNYARFLNRAIDSALSQNHANVEVIVVDDASTDGSADVISSYGARIKACLRKANGGHAAAFNTGFAESRGEIVFFLDADDYLYPTAVSELLARWDDDTAQMQFRLHLVDEGQRVKDIFPPLEVPFDSGDVTPQLARRARYQTTVTSGLAFARKALDVIMPVPEVEFRQGADGYLVTLAPLYGKVTSLDACLGAYRIHGWMGVRAPIGASGSTHPGTRPPFRSRRVIRSGSITDGCSSHRASLSGNMPELSSRPFALRSFVI